jgi:hypothetical protein
MWWTQAQKRYEGTKHTSELFQVYQPHRLRPQKMHKKRVKRKHTWRENILLGTIPSKKRLYLS